MKSVRGVDTVNPLPLKHLPNQSLDRGRENGFYRWIFWDHLWASKTICDYFKQFPTHQELLVEKMNSKMMQEGKQGSQAGAKEKKKGGALEKNDLQWLSQNTHFEPQNIKNWHQVGINHV